jgi:hypothetical protein
MRFLRFSMHSTASSRIFQEVMAIIHKHHGPMCALCLHTYKHSHTCSTFTHIHAHIFTQ